MIRHVFASAAILASLVCAGTSAWSQEASAATPAFTIIDPDAAVTPPPPTTTTLITFTSPLLLGEDGVRGKALVELIVGTPHYPPIEGIPEELWKGQKCSSCHEWTKVRLCEQAGFYATPEGASSLKKPHPLGADFKLQLKSWAESGCQ